MLLSTLLKFVVALVLNDTLHTKISVNCNKTPKPKKTPFDFVEVVKLNKEYSAVSNLCARRIVGGRVVERGELPYQVVLRRGVQNGKVWAAFCGGTIVTKTHVVTAAHCFETIRIRTTRVIAGTQWSSVYFSGNKAQWMASLTELQKTETWRKIKACHQHNNYNRRRIYNDMAILELEKPFVFSSAVNAIRMLSPSTKIKDHSTCLASGYGRTETGSSSKYLKMVCLPVVPYSTCGKLFRLHSRSTQICAGSKMQDSCQGDSGGPLVCEGQLVGIVSYGRAGPCGRFPGVYTLISGYTHGRQIKFKKCHAVKIYHNINVITMAMTFIYFYCFVTVFMYVK